MMSSKKKMIVGGAITAVVVAGVVAAAAWAVKNKMKIKVGDTVSLVFPAAVASPDVCASKGDNLTITGAVKAVDSAAGTASILWDTLTNPTPRGAATVPDAKCTEGGAVAVWKRGDKPDDAAWQTLWFGASAGVVPGAAIYTGVLPAIPPLSALKKKIF